MKRKRVEFKNATAQVRRVREEREVKAERDIYDLATPLWQKYYEAVRKSIRFPRYYKQEVNW